MTTLQTGHHIANTAVVHHESVQGRLTDALDNLALTTANDREILPQLPKANYAELTTTNQKLVNQMAEVVNAFKVLMGNHVKREQQHLQRIKTHNERFDPNGYKVTFDHISYTCTNQPGHRDDAMRWTPWEEVKPI